MAETKSVVVKKGGKKAQDSKKGKPSGAGRRGGKFEGFFLGTRERRLRHVCKRNGSKAARAYADTFGITASLRRLASENTRVGDVARVAMPNR